MLEERVRLKALETRLHASARALRVLAATMDGVPGIEVAEAAREIEDMLRELAWLAGLDRERVERALELLGEIHDKALRREKPVREAEELARVVEELLGAGQ